MNRLFLLGFVVLLGLFSSCSSRDNDEENKVEERETKKLPKWLENSAYALGRNGVKKADYPKVTFYYDDFDEMLTIRFEAMGGRGLYKVSGLYFEEINLYPNNWTIHGDSIHINYGTDGYGYIHLVIKKYNQYGDIVIEQINLPAGYELLGEKDKYSRYAKWLDIKQRFVNKKVNEVSAGVFTKLD